MADTTSPPRIAPVVIGIVLTAALLAFLAYATSKRRAQQASVPALAILTPADGAAADSPLIVRFTTGVPIKLGVGGWGVPGLHLHAWVNDVQYMPAATDIVAHDTTYDWRLPAVARGTATLRLGWADVQHRPIAAGSTPDISITVR